MLACFQTRPQSPYEKEMKTHANEDEKLKSKQTDFSITVI